jgi:protein SCO1
LRQAIEKLGSNASQVQVIFISVDWKRDTPEKLSAYTNAFHSDFIGLTGTKAQIDSVTKDYGIFYLLNLPDSQGYYSVDHTATMQVLDRQGNLVLTWPNGIESDEITSDLRSLLRKFATTTP